MLKPEAASTPGETIVLSCFALAYTLLPEVAHIVRTIRFLSLVRCGEVCPAVVSRKDESRLRSCGYDPPARWSEGPIRLNWYTSQSILSLFLYILTSHCCRGVARRYGWM